MNVGDGDSLDAETGSSVSTPRGSASPPRPPRRPGEASALSAAELDDVVDRDELRGRYEVLLQELRVVLPGVQVLLAFFLTVPFASRFEQLDDTGRYLFGVALGAAFGAAVCLMSPAVLHRTAGRTARSRRLVWSIRLDTVGLTLLAVSMVVALACVTRLVFGGAAAAVVSAAAFVLVITAWLIVPRSTR